ncbi:hypothetical protein ATANTOWER_010632 [Ataeniobius toweri]|uniref:C-type lectin domain-containing protein n=1 Tax=Ataeniobius toweri TaxID=208326 RepID=A0ABU7CGT1_9TELE|nr:hypothetical protein [Ataeniobius toweri]
MGKKSRPELMLLFLFNAVIWMEARLQRTIYFPGLKLTWTEAREYCQNNYIDMFTWDTMNMNLLSTCLVKKKIRNVWIGLHEDPEQDSVWKFINVKTGKGLTGEDVSQSKNWATGQQFKDRCGSYNSFLKKWYSKNCSKRLYFSCYEDNLVLVTENKTCEDALNHCREMTTAIYKYDLLSFRNSSDFSYVRDQIYRATTEEVWTGLQFLGGEWWQSDGKTLDPQEMLPDCPNQWEHCGTMSKYNTANWIIRDCSERRNFICYYKRKKT